MKTKYLLLVITFLLIPFAGVLANKTSVTLEVPAQAAVGEDVKIIIHVTHVGNTKGHHTEWVYLKVNGQEVKRWSYDKTNLPVDQNFDLEFIIKATENLQIEAEGNCNLHGTAGPGNVTVGVK